MRFWHVLMLLIVAVTARAEQYVSTGDYSVHYNALLTEMLTPEVARTYGITRSKNLAMLNVTVLKKDAAGLDQPVTADVAAAAVNLTGQMREVSTRLIEEQDARYYVGVLRVANQETLKFTIQVKVEDRQDPIEISFSQKFYTD